MPPILGESGSGNFPTPVENESPGFMNLACFSDTIQAASRELAMQLLFYFSGDDQNSKRLEAAVHKVIPEGQIEVFKKLEGLRERLRMPVEPDSVAVLSASNREELQQMQPLRGLLTEIYVILVIPDRKKSKIELAHLLLPRFLSRKGSDFTDLEIVLNKMYINSQHAHNGELFKES